MSAFDSANFYMNGNEEKKYQLPDIQLRIFFVKNDKYYRK